MLIPLEPSEDITTSNGAPGGEKRPHAHRSQRLPLRQGRPERGAAHDDDPVQDAHRLRALLEAVPAPMLVSRVDDGVILFANDRLGTLLGTSPHDLIGRRTPDFYLDPADRARVLEAVQREGELRDFELRIMREDAGPGWVSLSVQRLLFGGEPALVTTLIDITDRKLAEEALRASEEGYRCLFNGLEELVYVQDFDGRFLDVNGAVLDAYGYSREEIIGQTPHLLAAPGTVDPDAFAETFAQAAAGKPQRFDWWGRRKDGTIFPKDVVLKRATYFGREVVLAVARDISERVEAETALRRSEEHFRRLINNASDLISILDTEGTVLYQSPAVTPMLGYAADELLGRNVFNYLPAGDAATAQERLQRLTEHPGERIAAEFRFRHKDGSWRVIESIGTTLCPTSADDGVVVNSRDVTDRRRAEMTLRLQKTLLEAQSEASIDGILVVSDDGSILSYNQRFVDMWGLSAETVASGSDEAAIREVLDQLQDPDAFLARIDHLYAHPDERARDVVALRDGRVFDRYSSPVVSSEGDYYGRIWFFRDMTEQKRHTEALERAQRQAEQARMEAAHYATSLERELENGRRIQRGLLPQHLPQPEGWEIAVRFRPVWQVAGDFYDVFELPSGHVGFLIADVSGKGVGAALFMALFQSFLRASTQHAADHLMADTAPGPVLLAEVVSATNDYITDVHRHAHMFASVFFGLLDPATGDLWYVNAGHEPPVLVAAEGTRTRLTPTGPALGLLPGAAFEVKQTRLRPGSVLLGYTDGTTEARDEHRAFFGEERLLALLSDPADGASSLLDRVEAAVAEFVGEAEAFDDVTLLSIRRDG